MLLLYLLLILLLLLYLTITIIIILLTNISIRGINTIIFTTILLFAII